MILFDVLYGQEVWNARFLTERGAAVKCGRLDEIPEKVKHFLENPWETGKIIANALSLGKPQSGIKAAEAVLKLAYAKVRL